MNEARKSRLISANDMHVIWTQLLDAASDIHIAMCLFDDDHHAQGHLNKAMHSALSGAEQCRQLHKQSKTFLHSDREGKDDE